MKAKCLVALALVLQACPEDKTTPKQLYFKELVPPVGVRVAVLDDVNVNTPAGGRIVVTAVVEPDIDREELGQLMRSFYRQASSRRRGFRDGKPRQIEMKFYDSEAKAAAQADDWLGLVELVPPEAEPTYANRQRIPLLRWVKEALGRQPQYSADLKPQILVDAEASKVEIAVPFVKYDGSGAYVDELSYVRATTELASVAMTLFEQIEQLDRLTFVGKHRGQTMIEVTLSRDQYRQINLRQVEETLEEYRGRLINMKLAGKVSDKKMATMLAKRRRELYGEVFARLPDQNVQIDQNLR